METELSELAKKKKKEGWIHAKFMIEVLAVTEEAARSALDKHVQLLEKEKKAVVFKTDFGEIKEIPNPLPKIEKGYSIIVDIELMVENLDTLTLLVMNYAPSAIEVLHPDHLKLDSGEIQNILNSVADMIHQFARRGLGGIIVKS